MNEPQEIESKLKELMPELIEKFHIEKLGYFNKPIGWEFFDLQDLLETHLKRKIDLVSIKALKEQIRESILNQVKYV
ncbi:MAG: hypothetical protein A2X61_14665 [Ignavibacteria bacterium GWB2_35_12]|nr:MAG: hypothetical protein A2X63_06590 [Ignavibacteria bacterium GWA2_35_8]OGU38326.1 MAG: hypothetical protein A2X61_14665 [Ignavibacteria bacterium GWB2_35_12]OGU95773.1 MAG: hypothetical protein A2220_03130 [Ignavibacteria bacterium RIFOXYA2_FULL_35_10]OGV23439.1 MAG: hypothetical protein A2475_06590 [Ignavibacteria bacterium RIFOXYC2_FULL_35_21]